MRHTAFILTFLILGGISLVANPYEDIAEDIHDKKLRVKNIMVMPFENRTYQSNLNKISEKVIEALVQEGTYNIVEEASPHYSSEV